MAIAGRRLLKGSGKAVSPNKTVVRHNDEVSCPTNLISLSQPNNTRPGSFTTTGQFAMRRLNRYVIPNSRLKPRFLSGFESI